MKRSLLYFPVGGALDRKLFVCLFICLFVLALWNPKVALLSLAALGVPMMHWGWESLGECAGLFFCPTGHGDLGPPWDAPYAPIFRSSHGVCPSLREKCNSVVLVLGLTDYGLCNRTPGEKGGTFWEAKGKLSGGGQARGFVSPSEMPAAQKPRPHSCAESFSRSLSSAAAPAGVPTESLCSSWLKGVSATIRFLPSLIKSPALSSWLRGCILGSCQLHSPFRISLLLHLPTLDVTIRRTLNHVCPLSGEFFVELELFKYLKLQGETPRGVAHIAIPLKLPGGTHSCWPLSRVVA